MNIPYLGPVFQSNYDGFVKSPSAALDFKTRHGAVPVRTPHSSFLARPVSGIYFKSVDVSSQEHLGTGESKFGTAAGYNTFMARTVVVCLLSICLMQLFPSPAAAFMSDEDIARYQLVTRNWPVGDRIAFWAGQFVGTPYDPDPLGCYVRQNVIVSDDKVDCMYLTFRAVELALSKDPDEAGTVALEKRFSGMGVVQEGKVLNYNDRFAYGEDMIESGKWGKEITAELGRTEPIRGSRGRDPVPVLSARDAEKNAGRLQSGDIVFFVRNPAKRISDEIVGHIGIIKKEANKTYLIHASGLKNKGGKVTKTLLADYLKIMPFIGIRVNRFDPDTAVPE